MVLPATFLAFVLACAPRLPDGEPPTVCESGLILEGSDCIPASCGTGPWGNLPVDDDTVHVDATAAEGGDGTAVAPYATIQDGLDRAGAREGGLVAVAAGIYSETLAFSTDHADVRLAGRCREMVILDASAGDGKTPAILIDTMFASVEAAGFTVKDSSESGLTVWSGNVLIQDAAIIGSDYVGAVMFQPSSVSMEGCILEGNAFVGLYAEDQVTLRDTTIRDTRPDADGHLGWGIEVYAGATLSADGCLIEGNTSGGLDAGDPGTHVALLDTIVRGTRADADGGGGHGFVVGDGATLSSDACLIEGNMGSGLEITGAGTEVVLRDTTIRNTLPAPDGDGGIGIFIDEEASILAERSLIEGNRSVGVLAADTGTHVTLLQTTVRDTWPDGNGKFGRGIEINEGASLLAEDCLIEGSSGVGLLVGSWGTQATLRDSVVRNTRWDASFADGMGIGVQDGAMLSAEGCLIEGNTGIGIFAASPGTRVSLRDTIARGTLPDRYGKGLGIEVTDEASLSARGCLIEGNSGIGLWANSPGTRVALRETVVRDTQPMPNGEGGPGIYVDDEAALSADACLIEGNTSVGILVSDPGTRATLRDSTISGTEPGANMVASTATGLVSQEGAMVTASHLAVLSNQGPGILANAAGILECVGCSI